MKETSLVPGDKESNKISSTYFTLVKGSNFQLLHAYKKENSNKNIFDTKIGIYESKSLNNSLKET